MNTPADERFESAFAELSGAAAMLANPADPSALRGRLRRRRTTRTVVAGVAVLAALTSTAWWIQQATGEEDRPPIIDEVTTSASPEAEEETAGAVEVPGETTSPQESEAEAAPPPTFDDLVGAEIDLLSSFEPGSASVDSACPPDGAVFLDGRPDWENGRTFADLSGATLLLKVVHARLHPDGPLEAVALLGCRVGGGEAMLGQAVVVAADGSGGWAVTDELMVTDSGGGRPYDLTADSSHGVLIGAVSGQGCCEDYSYWVERARRDGSAIALERSDESALGAGVTDLEVGLDAVPGEAEGEWTVTAVVANVGAGGSAPFALTVCATPEVVFEDESLGDCTAATATVGTTVDALAPGERHEEVWTVRVAPPEEWGDRAEAYGGPSVSVGFVLAQYGIGAVVRDTDRSNDADSWSFSD